MVFHLPGLPWQDVEWIVGDDSQDENEQDVLARLSGTGEGERLPRGCAEWSVAVWAAGFVLMMLLGATHGVFFVGLELVKEMPINAEQWMLLVFCILFFSVVEGLWGFHMRWSPWVVRRSLLLPQMVIPVRRSPKKLIVIALAPFFAMGFFYASRRRLLISAVLYPGIALLIVLVKLLPKPYHEIVDLGVAAGIGLGTISFVYHLVDSISNSRLPPDADKVRNSQQDESQPLLI